MILKTAIIFFSSSNQLQRHATSQAVPYSSKSSVQHMQKLASALQEPNFDKKTRSILEKKQWKGSKRNAQNNDTSAKNNRKKCDMGTS